MAEAASVDRDMVSTQSLRVGASESSLPYLCSDDWIYWPELGIGIRLWRCVIPYIWDYRYIGSSPRHLRHLQRCSFNLRCWSLVRAQIDCELSDRRNYTLDFNESSLSDAQIYCQESDVSVSLNWHEELKRLEPSVWGASFIASQESKLTCLVPLDDMAANVSFDPNGDKHVRGRR